MKKNKTTNVRVIAEFDQEMETSDGVILRANIFRPDGEGPFPVLMTRLPYGKDGFYETGFHQGAIDPIRAAKQGYIVVVQDVRGTHASDGDFAPFRNEYKDGAAAAKWAASLPGSSGKVGLYGLSYFGFTQLAAAFGPTPEIHAIAPRMRCADSTNGLSLRQGALELGSHGFWYTMMSFAEAGRHHQGEKLLNTIKQLASDMDSLSKEGYIQRPINRFASINREGVRGLMTETFFAATREPANPNSVELEALNITNRLDHITAPAFHIAGWYDIFQQQTLNDYIGMTKRGVPCQLMIGPGPHGAVTGSKVGERFFGMHAGDLSINIFDTTYDMQIRWFDRWLKGDESKAEEKPVKVFIMGEDRWQTFDQWPVPATSTSWYLQADGGLNTSIHSTPATSTYVYDPDNPVPLLGGNTMQDLGHPPGPFDQRPVEARDDVLVFTSQPLTEDLTVIGRISASIWATSDVVDTDFVVRLCDVSPDGTSWNIVDGIVRAQYRDGYDNPSLIEPGKAYRYDIDLWSTANTFKKGNRIRVHVTSSSFPHWDANPNTGAPFSSVDVNIANQTIHHGSDMASSITLPIV
ncbi:CocE/NonD family hydrolase [Marinomonas sp.]|uniref:CocE/NonD family hydrolase n=1 Tax=Marinomonas sp. TaxID=1904862 RepID=UPI003BAA8E03